MARHVGERRADEMVPASGGRGRGGGCRSSGGEAGEKGGGGPNQEVAGEAGFDDLLAMTQVKMSVQAKLEMARNFWDEMGRGREKGMHGPMLERLAAYFEVAPTPETVLPESLALGNTMIALARHR